MKQRGGSTAAADWLRIIGKENGQRSEEASALPWKITGDRPRQQQSGLRASQLFRKNDAPSPLRQHSDRVALDGVHTLETR